LIDEEHEVSCGAGRKRARSNARQREPAEIPANDGGSNKVS